MKKRNKIKLPRLKEEDGLEKSDTDGKLNIENLQDGLDEEEPLPLIGGIKKINQIPIEVNDVTQEEEQKYNTLFKEDVEILNLEDIDSEINSKVQLEDTYRISPHFRERDYVKLLNEEDQRELINHIKRFGTSDNDRDQFQESEDDRLPLNNKEKKVQDARRRKLIQDVMAQDANDAGSREWETNLMNRVQIHAGPVLPSLCKEPMVENALEQELSKIQHRKKQLNIQLTVLESHKSDLERSKDDLIMKIQQLCTG